MFGVLGRVGEQFFVVTLDDQGGERCDKLMLHSQAKDALSDLTLLHCRRGQGPKRSNIT